MSESPTKKTADMFTAARSLYNTRKRLREKSDKLMSEADPKVRAICESIEEEEASELVPVEPSSPTAA